MSKYRFGIAALVVALGDLEQAARSGQIEQLRLCQACQAYHQAYQSRF